MSSRRAIVGLCLLCTLAFSVLAASSASASTKGTTGYTCKKKAVKGGAGFSKEHCTPADAVAAEAEYEHVAIAEETTTEITANNNLTGGETETIRVQSTQAGIAQEIQAELVEKDPETSAWVTNRKDGSGEHYIEGEINLTFTNVKFTKPAESGCKVFGKPEEKTAESFTTNRLLSWTKGEGDAMKISPTSGSVFAEFFVTGCKSAPTNGTYKIEGSLVVEVDGATIRSTETKITEQGTLKIRGQKAGLQGTLTIKSTDTAAGDNEGQTTAYSATTVETP